MCRSLSPLALPRFLRFTPEIRHHIYLHLGVGQRRVYGDAVPIIYDLGDPSSFKLVNEKAQFDDEPANFHSLLLSCRTIYLEVSAVLYSANWFVIHYQPRQSLKSLRALTPHALASLSNIKIVLNQASCHRPDPEGPGFGPCCDRSWAYKKAASPNGAPVLLYGCFHGDDHDYVLTKERPHLKAFVEEWQRTAAYLASHIIPGKLELLVLDGVRLLPLLKDCHIRQCETRQPQLQQLAQEAVLHARGSINLKPQEFSSSSLASRQRLLTLPPEIRLRVLQYTDLITPCKEVMWNRSLTVGGYYIKRAPCYESWGPGFCNPECGQACQFSHCWHTRTMIPRPSIGCFCRALHTAASSRCRCWAPPAPLFLVCRTLHAESSTVFYSHNRFVVIDSPGICPFQGRRPGDDPHKSFAASEFLRRVVPTHCLRYLGFLEVVFSAFSYATRPRDDHPAFRDWDETVEWARDKLNLPVLTLRLVVAGHPETGPGRGPWGSGDTTRAQGKEVLATYNRLLLPLRRLGRAEEGLGGGGGLARFYARLPWPLRWSKEVGRRFSDMDLESKDWEIKVRAERFVMGERYESVSAAGAEPHMSCWWWGALDLFI
ncbi:hypothetical protein N658DRAFT_566031 [Parathielavia hyrcaniae]|uniref:F-box domain-containing protein n=1 Tax=Parathielavia hyrcaniae TaxID=113614 RepID=A0AAN6Q2T2_9PEZI|nr:hypothetical protein N658DRAFT_566031 [Parathielavia hyrcaniae]